MTTVYTVGHGLLDQDLVLANLRHHGVELVLDVRSYPMSAMAPQFNQDALREALEGSGIMYVWMGRTLGGRPPARLCTAAGAPDYEKMVDEPGTKRALDEVVREAASRRVALLCSESRPESCHRSRMLEPELESRGAAVEHILPDGTIAAQPTLFS
jgi:uncharacterized protein (DUF488 family)